MFEAVFKFPETRSTSGRVCSCLCLFRPCACACVELETECSLVRVDNCFRRLAARSAQLAPYARGAERRRRRIGLCRTGYATHSTTNDQIRRWSGYRYRARDTTRLFSGVFLRHRSRSLSCPVGASVVDGSLFIFFHRRPC